MSAGKITAITVLLLLGFAVTAFGAYKYGSGKGYDKGQKAGYSEGYDAAPELSPGDLYKANKFDDVISDYNSLVSDYNTLRENVIRYVGQINYQARQPITCNSSSYGMYDQYTRTNCF